MAVTCFPQVTAMLVESNSTDSLLQISSDVIAVKLVAVLYREGLINHTVYRQVTAQYSTLVKPVKQ